MKQKAELVNEVASLKVELQQAKDERDHHLTELKTFQAEAAKYNDFKDTIAELEVFYSFDNFFQKSIADYFLLR